MPSIFGSPVVSSHSQLSSATVATTINVGAGDLVIVCYRTDANPGTTTCADTGSANTFTPLPTQNAPSNGAWMKWFYVLSANAVSGDVVTVTATSSGTVGCIFVWSVPLTGIAAFDTNSAIADLATVPSPMNSGTFDTASTDEFIASGLSDSSQQSIWGAGTGYTYDGQPSSFPRLDGLHGSFQDGPTSNKVAIWTFTGGGNQSAAITAIAFKTAGGGGGGVPNSCMMMGIGI